MRNKPIEVIKMKKAKKNITVLCCSIICIAVVTSLARYANRIDILGLKIFAFVGLNLLNGLVAFAAMKLTKMEIRIDLKNGRQYLIGAAIAVALSILVSIIPALCGFSLVGEHTDFSWFKIIFYLLFDLLIIGPVEEFIFRVYLQDTFVGFFEKHSWLGVVIASFLFGLWHLINGSFAQVLITFAIGLVCGFAKYKIKNCGYVGVAFAHGLYDYLNLLVTIFILQ